MVATVDYDAYASKQEGMAYERKTSSYANLAKEMSEKRLNRSQEIAAEQAADLGIVLDRGAAETLRTLLKSRYGSSPKGWRQGMDLRNTHFVGQKDFFKALRRIGYPGNLEHAWKQLGGTSRGKVTFPDIDADSAKVLGDFYRGFVNVVGPLSTLVAGVDARRVSQDLFLKRCQKMKLNRDTFHINLQVVFDLLQTGEGAVTEEDCRWLEYYVERKQVPEPKSTEEVRNQTRTKEVKEKRQASSKKRQLHDFKMFLHHRFGSVIEAWRDCLDKDDEGEISWGTFEEIVGELGFKDDLGAVWEALLGDDEDRGLSLKMLEPAIDEAQKHFISRCVQRFGSVEQAFREFDCETAPLVSEKDFNRLCIDIRFEKNRHLLFEYLDDRGVGLVSLDALDLLAAQEVFGVEALEVAKAEVDDMDPPPQERKAILEIAAEQCASNKRDPEAVRSNRKALVALLEERYESAVRGWSRCIDPKAKGKLNRKEFMTGASAAGFTGNVSALWAEIGLHRNALIRFRDLCPEVVEEIKVFKTSVGKRLVAIIQGAEATADPGADRKFGVPVPNEEFWRLLETIHYEGDVDRLMAHLDPVGDGCISTRYLRCVHEAKNEEKVVANMLKKYRQTVQTDLHKKIAALVVPPKVELLAKQDKLLENGREERKDKVDGEKVRQDFLRSLVRKFSSIVKAWQLALDPEGTNEVETPEKLLKGLKRSGLVKVEGMEESALKEKAKVLFEQLLPEDKKTITLADLDPITPALLEKFKDKCELRFGSLQQAFEEIDPEATGTVSLKAFQRLCHMVQLSEGVRRLMDLLDPQCSGEINLEKIDEDVTKDCQESYEHHQEVLGKRKERIERRNLQYMTVRPKALGVPVGPEAAKEERAQKVSRKKLAELKSKLIRKHGTVTRAWRGAFEDLRSSVSESSFASLFEEAGMPPDDAKIAWSAITPDKDGKVSLLQFEPELAHDYENLKHRLAERYWKSSMAFHEIARDDSFSLDFKAFLELCYEIQYRGNERRLFEYLDVEDEKVVKLSDIDPEAVKQAKARRSKEANAKILRASKDTDHSCTSSFPPATARLRSAGPENGVDIVVEKNSKLDAVKSFRDFIERRFGSVVKAWKAIDSDGLVALEKDEFVKAVAATGYMGNPSVLWAGLLEENEVKTVSIRELDPKIFAVMASLRRACNRKLRSFESAFEDETEQPVLRLTEEKYLALCKKVAAPKSCAKLFYIFDTKASGSISWSDVSFLEDHWDWQGTKGEPIRQERHAREVTGQHPGSPARVQGLGHLCMNLRPRMVSLRKSSSLPSLQIGIRAQWNDRHHIHTHLGNADSQMIHLATKVNTQDQERCKLRVLRRLEEVPTMTWFEQWSQQRSSLPDADGGSDEDDEDYD